MVNFALDNETTFAYHNFILRYFFSLVFYLMLLEVWGITFGHKYMKEIPTQVHLILPN